MRPFYKNWFIICIFFVLSMWLFILTENESDYFIDYYNAVYHRRYFMLLYLPAFLLGLSRLCDDFLTKEVIIRYSSIKHAILSLQTRNAKYCLLISGIMCITNVAATLLLCNRTHFMLVHFYVFLGMAFIFQWLGWMLICDFYMILRTLCRRNIVAWILTVIAIGLPAQFMGTVDIVSQKEYIFSIYKGMFIIEGNSFIQLMIHGIYFAVLQMTIVYLEYLKLKETDFLDKKDIQT